MTREDALQLFMAEANRLEKAYARQDDIIMQLAQLVADGESVLQKEELEVLVKIGATLYKANRSKKQARKDIADTMRKSLESDKSHHSH